ncbi:hypothetical protein Ciccas_000324 [Cichlidogyrus casuarinus]|uniref:Uncharacterized protein n=1 Tax=Cichlidogyrus casuarinus TaxID=1844966 RepID=A0ABD2QNA3_9PLAT
MGYDPSKLGEGSLPTNPRIIRVVHTALSNSRPLRSRGLPDPVDLVYEENCENKPESIPVALPTLMSITRQHFRLSSDIVNLGKLAVGTVSRSLFHIEHSCLTFGCSQAKTETYDYEWETTIFSNSQFVKVLPQSGRLDCESGKTTKCEPFEVIFTSGRDGSHKPALHEIDLVCKIRNRAKWNKYLKDVASYKTRKDKLENEFIITDRKLSKRELEQRKLYPVVLPEYDALLHLTISARVTPSEVQVVDTDDTQFINKFVCSC